MKFQMALAILTSRPSSHPFQERQITLNEPVKIGRAVARARPSDNNAIYDCKVLSRNHALLWYENGKFYLQDTKSSNGTFVNSHRLSKGSEESPPFEIHSGDVLQFGVDVMENSKRVTHSCIIASVQLFHADGREAKLSEDGSENILSTNNIQAQELYQLHQFIQEALQRETLLESKLAALQRLVSRISEASENGWCALISEDRLLSRVSLLEKQIDLYNESNEVKDEDTSTLRTKIAELHQRQQDYEITTKDSLKTIMEEKLDAVQKLVELEQSLTVAEQECTQLRDACENSQRELNELAIKHDDQIKEIEDIQELLKEAENKHADILSTTEREKIEYEERIEEMVKREEEILAKMEELQADKDFTTQQLNAIKSKLEVKGKIDGQSDASYSPPDIIKSMDRTQDDDEMELDVDNMPPKCPVRRVLSKSTASIEIQVNLIGNEFLDRTPEEIPNGFSESEDVNSVVDLEDVKLQQALDEISNCSSDVTIIDNDQVFDLQAKLDLTKQEIDRYKSLLLEAEERLQNSQAKIEELTLKLEHAEFEAIESAAKINTLTENLQLKDTKMNEMVEKSISELQDKLEDARQQEANRKNVSDNLQDRINELENDLDAVRNSIPDIANRNTPISSIASHLQSSLSNINDLQNEVTTLKEKLQHAEEEKFKYEDKVNEMKENLEKAKLDDLLMKSKQECLVNDLTASQKELKVKMDKLVFLEDQLRKSEVTLKETQPKIISVNERLNQEIDQSKKLNLENTKLRNKLKETDELVKTLRDEEKKLDKNYTEKDEIILLKKQLMEANDEIDSHKGTILSLESLKDENRRFNEEISRTKEDFMDLNKEFNELSYRSRMVSLISFLPIILVVFAVLTAFQNRLALITATNE